MGNEPSEYVKVTLKDEHFAEVIGNVYVHNNEQGVPHFHLKMKKDEVRVIIPQKCLQGLSDEDIEILDGKTVSIKIKREIVKWLKSTSKYEIKKMNGMRTITNILCVAETYNGINIEKKYSNH
jgi:hypothetical protein